MLAGAVAVVGTAGAVVWWRQRSQPAAPVPVADPGGAKPPTATDPSRAGQDRPDARLPPPWTKSPGAGRVADRDWPGEGDPSGRPPAGTRAAAEETDPPGARRRPPGPTRKRTRLEKPPRVRVRTTASARPDRRPSPGRAARRPPTRATPPDDRPRGPAPTTKATHGDRPAGHAPTTNGTPRGSPGTAGADDEGERPGQSTAAGRADDVGSRRAGAGRGVAVAERGTARGSKAARAAQGREVAQGRGTALYRQAMNHRARGDEEQALLSFRSALSAGGMSPDERADAERQSIALRRKFGEVEILCDVNDAQVAIDGRPVGRTPLPRPILVKPGKHTLTIVTGAGYRTINRTFDVAGGDRLPLRFSIGR